MESTNEKRANQVEALVKKARIKRAEILKMERAYKRFIKTECEKIDVKPSLIEAIIK